MQKLQTVLDSIPASSDTVESKGRQMVEEKLKIQKHPSLWSFRLGEDGVINAWGGGNLGSKDRSALLSLCSCAALLLASAQLIPTSTTGTLKFRLTTFCFRFYFATIVLERWIMFRIMLGFMVPTAFLSMWISNAATTAMMLPILAAVLDQLGLSTDQRYLSYCRIR